MAGLAGGGAAAGAGAAGIAGLSATLGTLGAVTSAVGTVAGGLATAGAASYQAQVARNNAEVERQNARQAIAAGQAQAAATSMKGAAQLGEIKASQAASGIDVNTGSAVDVQASERETNKLDSEVVLHNALLQNFGYRTQAVSDEAQAEMEDTKAIEAPIGAGLGAAGSLLSNASSISSKWLPVTG